MCPLWQKIRKFISAHKWRGKADFGVADSGTPHALPFSTSSAVTHSSDSTRETGCIRGHKKAASSHWSYTLPKRIPGETLFWVTELKHWCQAEGGGGRGREVRMQGKVSGWSVEDATPFRWIACVTWGRRGFLNEIGALFTRKEGTDADCTAKNCPLQRVKGRITIGTLNGPIKILF